MKNKMKVLRIDDQGNKILFLGKKPYYHVIASPDKKAKAVKIGDRIIYEPAGINFGWFVRIGKT